MRCFRWAAMGLIALLLPGMSMRGGTMDPQRGLPERLLVGYWHNFDNGSGVLKLRDIPDAYDVINVAFAVPMVPLGSTLQFFPDPSIYSTPAEFREDIAFLRSRGKAVLISIGGAAAPIHIDDSTSAKNFVSSLRSIIGLYGFDGVDIDVEGSSLQLSPGDTDFRHPTSPRIVNFIRAMLDLTDQADSGFVLSFAPETAFVQGGYEKYVGVYGAYLPVLYALRDRISYVHVQHYNSGSMYGRDGVIYYPSTADFHVAMADALLAGFTVDSKGASIPFPPFPAEKVLIGLPASTLAAGSGFTAASDVHAALDYLVLGKSFGGQYLLSMPGGYRAFRGLMTWSINWDVYAGKTFSNSHRGYLDSLSRTTGVPYGSVAGGFALERNYPNPFNPTTVVSYQLPVASDVRLVIFDLLGREVAVLVAERKAAGSYEVKFDAAGLPSGMYIYRLTAGAFEKSHKMLLIR